MFVTYICIVSNSIYLSTVKYTLVYSSIVKYKVIYFSIVKCTLVYSSIVKYTPTYFSTVKCTLINYNTVPPAERFMIVLAITYILIVLPSPDWTTTAVILPLS